LVVVGSGGVGKSCITLRYVQDILVEGHDPTIEDSYQKFIDFDGSSTRLDILDTAGQEEFVAIRNQNIRQGQGFLLVFSVTDRASYEKVIELHTMITRTKGAGGKVPIVIMANKADMEGERLISKEEEEKLAQRLDVPVFSTSAVSRKGIDESFANLVLQVRKHASIPCLCMGKCECFDKCSTCGVTRNRHTADHEFKFKKGFWGMCTLL